MLRRNKLLKPKKLQKNKQKKTRWISLRECSKNVIKDQMTMVMMERRIEILAISFHEFANKWANK